VLDEKEHACYMRKMYGILLLQLEVNRLFGTPEIGGKMRIKCIPKARRVRMLRFARCSNTWRKGNACSFAY